MFLWYMVLIITIVLTTAGFLYIGNRLNQFQWVQKHSYHGQMIQINAGYLIVTVVFILLWLAINLMNAVVCLFYFAMFWLISDAAFFIIKHITKRKPKIYYAGIVAILISVFALILGWYQNHHIWLTEYTIRTEKNVPPMKIALFADSHIGTTFDGREFAEHLKKIQAANPDAVFIAGDFVDDGTTRENMLEATKALKELDVPLGVYFVFGNHDKGYYGPAYRGFSAAELVNELQKNNVVILQDEVLPFNKQFYLIGRKDRSESQRGGNRLSMAELTSTLAKDKFSIVLDHQPNDYKAQQAAEADLVLSGHTHGGQLWPLNCVGEWIGANDKTYGFEKRGNTHFIVTSGLSDWAIKFKTGTKSEFVVVNIQTRDFSK